MIKTPKFQTVVFDLDDTLFDTSFRTRKIIKTFILNNQQYFQSKNLENTVNNLQIKYCINKTLAQLEIKNNLKNALKKYWESEFFSPKSLEFDNPIPYGSTLVKKFSQNNQIVYLTGRTQKVKGETINQLKVHGYPLETTQNLILKNDPSLDDVIFKVNQLRKLNSSHNIVKIFDNEPEILYQVKQNFPDISCHLFHSISKSNINEEKNHSLNIFTHKCFSQLIY